MAVQYFTHLKGRTKVVESVIGPRITSRTLHRAGAKMATSTTTPRGDPLHDLKVRRQTVRRLRKTSSRPDHSRDHDCPAPLLPASFSFFCPPCGYITKVVKYIYFQNVRCAQRGGKDVLEGKSRNAVDGVTRWRRPWRALTSSSIVFLRMRHAYARTLHTWF